MSGGKAHGAPGGIAGEWRVDELGERRGAEASGRIGRAAEPFRVVREDTRAEMDPMRR
jgi:hypothetical protein